MLAEPGPEHEVWLDGEFVPWSRATMRLCDHHYGFGVFEGVRAHKSGDRVGLFRLSDHTARLFRSAHILGIEIPRAFTPEVLDRAQVDLVRKNGLREAYVRPFVFHGGTSTLSPRGRDLRVHVALLAFAWLGGGGYGSPGEDGIKLMSASVGRHPNGLLVKAKAHANYMPAMLALEDARRSGADDALLYDQNGFVTEASAANVLVVQDGVLISPPRQVALEGITKDTVQVLAKGLGISVVERPMARDDLYVADEMFLTGSAVGVTPVRALDGRMIGNGQMGSVTRALSSAYQECVLGRMFEHEQWVHWVPS